MLYALAGYALLVLLNAIFGATRALWLVCLEYLLSGLLILLFNQAFHIRLSGHACGILAPMLLLASQGIGWAIPAGLALLLLAGAASLKMERHTTGQLIGGCIVPAVLFILLRQRRTIRRRI
ncbi:MAG: hypothetical protein IJ240_02200 [Clostridia bacterium]|nr:hypothetical protein [Clostridia bacterium]